MPDRRFLRQAVLAGVGAAGQRRLGAARVVVVGAGGLGCALLPTLVAAGVGRVTVVDDDVVETSNLHRQTLYGPGDVGRPKAEVAAARLAALGAGEVLALRTRVDAGNAVAVVDGADLVIDGSDDLAARYALDDAAAFEGVPLVWGSATAWTGQVGVAAADRGPRWRDLFPRPPASDSLATCAIAGVLPSLCATVGGLMATEALKLLTGAGEPLIGRMLVVDALGATVRAVPYGFADPTEEEPMAQDDEIEPAAVAERLDRGDDVVLLDVREPWEVEIAALPGSVAIPLGELASRVGELDSNREVIAYCHGGVRSLRATAILHGAGFRAASMIGGIDGWSRTVDPAVPRY